MRYRACWREAGVKYGVEFVPCEREVTVVSMDEQGMRGLHTAACKSLWYAQVNDVCDGSWL